MTTPEQRFQDMFEKFAGEMRHNFADLKKTCNDTNEKITVIESVVYELQKENIVQEKKIKELESKIEVLERQTRKNNVIYFGIEEVEDENIKTLEQNIINVITKKQEVNLNQTEINNVYRIGKINNERQPRPVIVSLTNFKRKTEILSSRAKLRGSDIFVNEDMTRKQQEVRKNLNVHAKRLREEGKRVSIKGDRIVIHENTYDIDELDCTYEEIALIDRGMKSPPFRGTGIQKAIDRTLRPRPTGSISKQKNQ